MSIEQHNRLTKVPAVTLVFWIIKIAATTLNRRSQILLSYAS